jgi:hypothetical protein
MSVLSSRCSVIALTLSKDDHNMRQPNVAPVEVMVYVFAPMPLPYRTITSPPLVSTLPEATPNT